MDAPEYAAPGAAALVLAFFCAWWAQHTSRNAWLWFFFGLLLPPVAGFVLLYKNSRDLRRRAP